ncbi:MAG TPA: hypothetical protein VK843_02120 [Planctomycetota bacterium]|nr:hypothetical protein [Planctomycetota bacterium]
MNPAILALWASSALVACATRRARDADAGPWQRAELGQELRDGNWRYYYPGSAHVLTEGRVGGGRRIGEWTTYYDEGSLFARGSYVDGSFEGNWFLWSPDGEINRRGSTTQCVSFAMTYSPAGSGDFPWSHFTPEQHEQVRDLLPFGYGGGWWMGTGFYEDGLRKRKLTDVELAAEGIVTATSTSAKAAEMDGDTR